MIVTGNGEVPAASGVCSLDRSTTNHEEYRSDRLTDRRIVWQLLGVSRHTQTHTCIPSASCYFSWSREQPLSRVRSSSRVMVVAVIVVVVVVVVAVLVVAVVVLGLFSVWLAEVRLTVPPLYDKHALVISIIEVECVMVTITVRGGLLVDRLRGGSGGGGYLRRKW